MIITIMYTVYLLSWLTITVTAYQAKCVDFLSQSTDNFDVVFVTALLY